MIIDMRSFIRIVGVVAALLAAAPAGAAEVVRMRVEDTIQPASQRYIERVLDEAAARDAALVVMELDTPGGMLETTSDIISAITSSEVPVVVFVAPGGAWAASAGFFILISADVAAMAPGTNTGAAHPVGGQGEDLPEDMRGKATSLAAAMVRSLAEQRGRNVKVAEQAVLESVSLTAEEALEKNVIDLVVDDFSQLLEVLDGTEITRANGETETLELGTPAIIDFETTFTERLLSVLAHPNVAYLLMALGVAGLGFEITHPGAILPGVVGAIALLLGLYSLSVLPVNWAGAALIFIALVLFVLEVKVTSYGLLTIGGLISFVLGSLMVFDGPIPAMRVSLGVVVPTAAAVALLTGFLLTRVLTVHRQRPMTGFEGLIDEEGEALGDISMEGKVLVHGEYWDARAIGPTLEDGARVRVVAVKGRRIDVVASDDTTEGSL